MRTLLFTLEYPPFKGGVANYYSNLVKYWPDSELMVLNDKQGKLVSDNLPFLKWLPSLLILWRIIKKNKVDNILVGQILPIGIPTYLISKVTNIKYSVILHGMDLSLALKISRKKWLAKKILKNSDKIICANNYTAGLVKDFLGWQYVRKILVVNPGADKETYYNTELIGKLKNKYNLKDKLVLLSVGRLVKRKGFDKVIEALPQVLDRIHNLVYIIIGVGEEFKNYQLLITNYHLENSVIIIADASDEERNNWYQLCDVFIMPARNINGDFEGFGMVYLEANLASKPVIAGDSGGIRDAVKDGFNGLLVNPESVDDIMTAIVKLARDENLRKKLGEQGRERTLKEFNWEGQVGKFYNIIENRITHNS